MNPRLVAVSGPLQGRTVPLDREVVSIGRHADCDVQILQPEVSRHHGEILRQEDGGFLLRDLDSRQGTFVNTMPVRERLLVHNDLVRVGESHFLFLADSPSEPTPSGPSDLIVRSTVQRSAAEAFYLRPDEVRRALPPGARIAADLNVLLELATAVQAVDRTDALAERLLDLLLDALPVERGSVLLIEPGEEEPTTLATRASGSGGEPQVVSRTILRQVLEERSALLSNDVRLEKNLGDAESVRGQGVTAVLAAPLLGRESLIGAVYLDAGEGAAPLDERHLELACAAASIAALAFESVSRLEWLRRENRRLRGEDHGLVGESPAMRRVVELIERVGPADSTILLRGESGTGKELAARAIHRASTRADGPFVAINCATLSETLLESELFGHEKGAFTGAVARKVGKVEAAHKGTLFLDEVGEIAPPLQARLLRVLQEREIERLGGIRPIPVDVRLIAATHRDLQQAIAEGSFREDLYYRLEVITLVMPPLRQRRDDVALLARHFAEVHGRRLGLRLRFAPETLRALAAYDWPGNVRQLGNVIERAAVLGSGETIRPEDLPDEVLEGGGTVESDYQATLTETKKRLIRDAFAHAGGDHHAAAKILGIHHNSLHRLLRNLGLKEEIGKMGCP